MKRFLVVRLSALGDVVCSLPVAHALKTGHPGCEISWAVDPRFAGIVDACASVDHVIRVKPSPRSWPSFEGRFDAVLDVQGLLKSGLCAARATSDTKVGFHWQREGAGLFTSPITPDPTSVHVVDQYVDVARAVGGVADRAVFDLAPTPEALAEVAPLLPTGPFAVVNAGAGWTTKRWAPERFAAIIDRLAERGIRSVLIGGKATGDREAADAVLALASADDLLGRTSVAGLVALISRASLHVGGDTGSTHVAAALGIPAVGLYGLTRPSRSCPYGQIDACVHDPRGLACVGVEDVWARVESALRIVA